MNVRWLIVLCLSVVGAACVHTIDAEVENTPKEVQFKVQASALARSGKEVFAVGDSIGIYAVKRTEDGISAIPAQTGNQAHNAKWVKTEDGWQPASPIDKVLWSQDNAPLDFYAYYPYQREAFDPAAINVRVHSKQNSEVAVEESDVLRAANTRGLSEGEVELQFEHIFSLVEVKLVGDSIVAGSLVKVTANEIATNMQLNLGTGELSPLTMGSVALYCVDLEQMLYKAVLPAQQVEEGCAFLQCEFDGITCIYRSPGIRLEPACLQEFEIEVK